MALGHGLDVVHHLRHLGMVAREKRQVQELGVDRISPSLALHEQLVDDVGYLCWALVEPRKHADCNLAGQRAFRWAVQTATIESRHG